MRAAASWQASEGDMEARMRRMPVARMAAPLPAPVGSGAGLITQPEWALQRSGRKERVV